MSWPKVFWPPQASSHEERRHLLRKEGPRLTVLLSNPFKPGRTLEFEAIVDTGASCICVSRRIVKELELTRTAPTRMIAVGADHPAGVYAANVGVPALDFSKFMRVVAPDGAYSSPAVLLGREFLHLFDFSYNGLSGTYAFHSEADRTAPLPEFDGES